jgi:hypothetical protein
MADALAFLDGVGDRGLERGEQQGYNQQQGGDKQKGDQSEFRQQAQPTHQADGRGKQKRHRFPHLLFLGNVASGL